MATTTFGYNPVEDRVWMVCSHWQRQRLWITRRCAQEIMQAVCRVLEQSAAAALGQDAPARAEAEHDAAINRPSVSGHAMQTGREASSQPAPSAQTQYLLCLSARVSAGAHEAGLAFQTPEGEISIAFDREGLHRWLRALYLMLQNTAWNVDPLPQWVTRSYLPPALRALLTQPASPDAPGDETGNEIP